MTTKSNNPKDLAAIQRVRLDLIPGPACVAIAQALAFGIPRYGAWSWRHTPIEAGTYLAASIRHMKAWQDREELAPDSQVGHLGHAAASLAIIMDAMACGTLIDDRPPAAPTARLLTEAAARA